MYMQRTLSQGLLFSHSLGVGALQFSAPQPLCHISHHHSNIILNKQEGNSEKCFMFFLGESFKRHQGVKYWNSQGECWSKALGPCKQYW